MKRLRPSADPGQLGRPFFPGPEHSSAAPGVQAPAPHPPTLTTCWPSIRSKSVEGEGKQCDEGNRHPVRAGSNRRARTSEPGGISDHAVDHAAITADGGDHRSFVDRLHDDSAFGEQTSSLRACVFPHRPVSANGSGSSGRSRRSAAHSTSMESANECAGRGMP